MIEDQIKHYLKHHLKIDIQTDFNGGIKIILKLDDEVISTGEDRLLT